MFFTLETLHTYNDYFFYYLTKVIGKSNIYYRQMYNYLNTGTGYTINKIVVDNNELTLGYFYNSIPACYDKLMEVNYTVNNKTYWIQYDNVNKSTMFKFPLYINSVGEAFRDTDDSIILVTLNNYTGAQGTVQEDRLLNIIKELSGPKGNFYKDLGYKLCKKTFTNRINRELLYELNDTHTIEIMYSNGEILTL